MLHRVGDQRDHEADEQDLLPVEQPVDERREGGEEQRQHDERASEHRAGERGFLHNRPATDAPAATVGDRSADFLLEREEEPGRDDEHEDPQPVERCILGLVERLEGEDLEPVRRESRDHQPEADCVGTFGQRHLASSVDDALCALRHFAGPEWPE